MGRRVFLIDFDEDAAATRVKALKKAGWSVDVETIDGALAWKRMREDPPDVVAIDLSRLPSHGREAGRAVRSAKDLRDVPIVFFGGTSEAQTRAAGVVPGAILIDASDLIPKLNRLMLRAT